MYTKLRPPSGGTGARPWWLAAQSWARRARAECPELEELAVALLFEAGPGAEEREEKKLRPKHMAHYSQWQLRYLTRYVDSTLVGSHDV